MIFDCNSESMGYDESVGTVEWPMITFSCECSKWWVETTYGGIHKLALFPMSIIGNSMIISLLVRVKHEVAFRYKR